MQIFRLSEHTISHYKKKKTQNQPIPGSDDFILGQKIKNKNPKNIPLLQSVKFSLFPVETVHKSEREIKNNIVQNSTGITTHSKD